MRFTLPVDSEVRERLDRLEIPFNEYGVDRYGISKQYLGPSLTALKFFFRHYFSVESHGIENVPAHGRVMLVGNHSGGVAIDGAMVHASQFFEMNPPRLAQGMAEKFLNKIPFASQITNRCGHLTGLPEHAERLLEDDRMLMVFPEGARGTAKLYWERHSLVDFGTGFLRLAMKTRTPIVPVGILGGGEAIPSIANSATLGKLVGAPYVPITPYLLALPLPVKMELHFGEPMFFDGTGNEEDEAIQEGVESVKSRVASLMADGLLAREGGRG